MEIKSVTAADIDELVALARKVWHQHYPAIISTAQIEYMLAQRYSRDVIAAELQRSDIWWDQLRADERMMAFSSYFKVDAGEMKLDKLYVHPQNQRRGYGGMLLDRAVQVAREQRCSRLKLAVNKGNANAISAYKKHGFHVTESVIKDIGSGFVMDDYTMVRDVCG